VLRAVDYAREAGMRTIGVTGYDGGKLRRAADVSVHVPVWDMGMVEALHGVVFHLAMTRLRERVTVAQPQENPPKGGLPRDPHPSSDSASARRGARRSPTKAARTGRASRTRSSSK
jgi:hypothetical protein